MVRVNVSSVANGEPLTSFKRLSKTAYQTGFCFFRNIAGDIPRPGKMSTRG
jgi:hypothetical protein